MRALISALFLLGAGGFDLVAPACRADEATDRLTLAVDVLTRLEGIDLETNPAMKERVFQVLARTRGTPNFVRIVRHFSLKGQDAGLIEVAVAMPRDEYGVEAIKMVLAGGGANVIATMIGGGDARARALAEALGHSGHRDSVKLLVPALGSARSSDSIETNRTREFHEQVIRSLALSSDGARELLELVKGDKLKDPLRNLALDELTQVRWEPIKAEAITMKGQPAVNWPGISELARMKADSTRGQTVYFRANPGCFNCHVVNGQGTDLGPNLSEIGGKLAKEALFQAILEPSAGISLGYEAFTLTLKDGDEAYGLVASETASEVAIKTVGGVVTRYPKADIVSSRKSALSLMPSGLEAGLTPQELVDLVAYLASLKKAE